MKVVFCISLLVAGAVCKQNWNGGQGDWYCGILMNEDCNSHHLHQRCGTDGITYRNMCDLGQAHCRNNVTNQQHEGQCLAVSTENPQQVLHGSEVVLDVMCTVLSHRDCVEAHYEKICATDGYTYRTFCEYEKARCTHRDLHVVKLGDCNA